MSWRCIYNNTQTYHYDKQNILGSAAAYLCPELTVPRSLYLPHTQSLLTQCLCTIVSCLTVYCPSLLLLFLCRTNFSFSLFLFKCCTFRQSILSTSPEVGKRKCCYLTQQAFPSAATCQPGSLAHFTSGTLYILKPLLFILSWLCLFSQFLEDIYLRLTNPCVLNSWVETMPQSNWPARVC